MMIPLMKRLAQIGLLIVLIWLFYAPSSVYASSPTVVFGHVDSRNCVNRVSRVIDIDTLTRDALPGEIVTSTYADEAVRANAILIRSFAYYFYLNPEWNAVGVCNEHRYFFNLRTTRIQGWVYASGAEKGNAYRTNDKVTDTLLFN